MHGILPEVTPLERWEISQPGNVLRVFERGGGTKGEIGNPQREEDPGRPDVKLSSRGFGTQLRTDPVFLGLQKTRLLDPLPWFPGTNDQPGDYRASGCSGCHVVYANDRSREHSGPYAQFGNSGQTASADPTIPRGESGHPIRHAFTRSIPSSQCMVCHVHPGTNMVTTYFGYTWWDNEADGDTMYPKEQRHPTEGQRDEISQRNPEGAAIRGLWSDPNFLARDGQSGVQRQAQERPVRRLSQSRLGLSRRLRARPPGQLLDAKQQDRSIRPIPKNSPRPSTLRTFISKKACTASTATSSRIATATASSTASRARPSSSIAPIATAPSRNAPRCEPRVPPRPSAARLSTRCARRGASGASNGATANSTSAPMVEQEQEWEVVQTLDSITPGNPHYNEKSAVAKTLRTDGSTWGDVPADETQLAHANSSMTCYACHTSWTPNCFGCHLAMTRRTKQPMLHNEGLDTRNWTSYNFQVLRDDGYMLGVDGTVTGHRVAPARSSCAILVSSQNAESRLALLHAADGFGRRLQRAGLQHLRAAHRARARNQELHRLPRLGAARQQRLDGHAPAPGHQPVNFMGRYVYVADGNKGFEAVATAEHDEPEAVIGSDLQRMAYPDDYKQAPRAQSRADHRGPPRWRMCSTCSFAANISTPPWGRAASASTTSPTSTTRISPSASSPRRVSPLGQSLYMKTRYAMAVATPTTLGVDPLRTHAPGE